MEECDDCSCEDSYVPSMATVGEMAPDFTVDAAFGQTVKEISLSDYRGKWVVLLFYPLDFTFVCPTEIKAFAEAYDQFKKMDTEVIGMSVDSVHSHMAWMRGDLGEMPFPMASDMTKEVSYDYNVLIEDAGISLRGVFLIDPEGILKMAVVHDNSIGRNVDEVLRVVQAAQTGDLCPINWKPGQKTLGKA
jgi:peroxiredoxin (alkyl hydroperoxide reductase subunit C)